MAKFKISELESYTIEEKIFKVETEKDNKHLKGYIYDSLAYRYIRAREAMAEWEWERDRSQERSWYFKQANRDIMRFCQILNEVVGERE